MATPHEATNIRTPRFAHQIGHECLLHEAVRVESELVVRGGPHRDVDVEVLAARPVNGVTRESGQRMTD